jgi:hypothetical protein
MVKLGTHEKSQERKRIHLNEERFKNISLILVQNGRTEEAKKSNCRG